MQVGARVNLDSVLKLGVDAGGLRELRAAIEKAKPDLARTEGLDKLEVSVIAQQAKLLGRPQLADALERVFSGARPSKVNTRLTLKPEQVPTPRVSLGEAREVPAGSGTLSPKQLDTFRPQLEALMAARARSNAPTVALDADPIDARALAEILRTDAHRLAGLPSLEAGMTRASIVRLEGVVAEALRPATATRAVTLDLPSTFTPVAGANGARVFHKVQLDRVSATRGEAVDGRAPLKLQGFVDERLAIQVPKGHGLFVIDAMGNEIAARAPRVKRPIDGQETEVVELGRSAFGQDGKGPITIKVVDPSGAAIFQDSFGFGPPPSAFSRVFAEGSIGLASAPAEPVARWAMDRATGPQGKATPPGRRPSLELAGAPGLADTLVIQRDGERFAVDELARLLGTPRSRPQAFRTKDATLTIEGRVGSALDEKPDELMLPFRIRSSRLAEGTHFADPYPMQSGWTELGVDGFTHRSATGAELARFDPFDPKQDLNLRKN
jgi:hypothetical protein